MHPRPVRRVHVEGRALLVVGREQRRVLLRVDHEWRPHRQLRRLVLADLEGDGDRRRHHQYRLVLLRARDGGRRLRVAHAPARQRLLEAEEGLRLLHRPRLPNVPQPDHLVVGPRSEKLPRRGRRDQLQLEARLLGPSR
eukprot:3918272-Prymnesium_polylepis.1